MQILIFSGTQDGNLIARTLSQHKMEVDVCVATAYGEECLMENTDKYLHCHTGRLTTEQMEQLMQQKEYVAVIDATHPFATQVSSFIQEACAHVGLEYIRFSRESGIWKPSGVNKDDGEKSLEALPEITYVENVTEASEKLAKLSDKRILFTTGSRDIRQLTCGMADKKGLFVRVLPAVESLQLCEEAGILKKQIIAMQGPFSRNMNLCMLKELQIDMLVTKESGATGGYPEKIYAAAEAGVEVLVIRNPEKKKVYDWDSLWEKLEKITGETFDTVNAPDMEKKSTPRTLTVVGIGPGDAGQLTMDAVRALRRADIIFGAESIVAHISGVVPVTMDENIKTIYQKKQILAYINQHTEYEHPVLVCSGDVGFYSGAAAFQSEPQVGGMDESRSINVRYVPGISSMIYFCAKIGTPWHDVTIASIHGRQANVIGMLRNHAKVFVLLSGKEDVIQLGEKLMRYHMENCKITVGYQLSMPQEKIFTITAEQLSTQKDDSNHEQCGNQENGMDTALSEEGLYVLLLQNENTEQTCITPGIPDEEFIRDKVPMTKEEVREVSIAKLHLQKNSVLFDIGAGTGSISVEAARVHDSIKVFAIEKNPQAIELLQQNKNKFAVDNMTIMEGEAPDIFEDMFAGGNVVDGKSVSVPTHAFIGGSSGNLSTIVGKLLELNPQIRIVINTVTLETLSEITSLLKSIPHKNEDVTQLSVTKTRLAGNYHLMQAANPVMIIAFDGER